MEKRILNRISRRAKIRREPLLYVVIQTADYCGGHRIKFFGYTKKYRETAMEIADGYTQENFTYILSYDAKEGDIYEEHYEPFHGDSFDVPVYVGRQKALFILN